MTIDQAVAILAMLLEVTAKVAGPILGAIVLGGALIGIVQTALQVNEAALAYVVKAACVLGVLLLIGPVLAETAARYARDQIAAIAEVVR